LPVASDERALLLSDDRDAERLAIVDPERLILLTTWDYLRQLEEAAAHPVSRCNHRCCARGRPQPPARDLRSRHDPDIRDAVKAIITGAHETKPAA
jgi:hypothetical protein